MTAQQYRRALTQRWRWWAGGLVVGLLVGVLAALFLPGQYRSQTALLFSSPLASADPTSSYQADLLARERTGYYVPLVTQERVTQEVAQRVGGGVTSRDVFRRLVASTPADTPILLLTVTDSSPARAQQTAAAAADTVVGLVTEIETPPVSDPTRPIPPQVAAGIVQPATFSAIPVSASRTVLVLLGALLGLIVGLVVALVREVRDRSVRTVADLRERTGLPVLAEFPIITYTEGLPEGATAAEVPEQIEAARRVRAVLGRLGSPGPGRVLAVAGVGDSGGAGSLAGTLARSLAHAGARVALVDADLRHFMPRDVPGPLLVDLLRGEGAAVDDAVTVDGVTLLPSGGAPDDAAELLVSPRLDGVLADLSARHETVLVSLSPVLPYAEPGQVAARTAGVLLVALAGTTTGEQVDEAVELLGVLGATVLGLVLTRSSLVQGSPPAGPDTPVVGKEPVVEPAEGADEPQEEPQEEPAHSPAT